MEMLLNIDVDDLEKAVAFYRDALGLQAGRRLFDGSVVEMAGASSKIHLLAKAPGSSASSQAIYRSYARHWTPVHLDFVVDEVESAVNRAVAAGAMLEGEIQNFNCWNSSARVTMRLHEHRNDLEPEERVLLLNRS